jgi:hypothetical protein
VKVIVVSLEQLLKQLFLLQFGHFQVDCKCQERDSVAGSIYVTVGDYLESRPGTVE